jgi:hypothetical protein
VAVRGSRPRSAGHAKNCTTADCSTFRRAKRAWPSLAADRFASVGADRELGVAGQPVEQLRGFWENLVPLLEVILQNEVGDVK